MAGGFKKIDEYNKSLTQEERKQSASKAGIASGKVRAKNKTLRDTLEELLPMELSGDISADIDIIKNSIGMTDIKITIQDAIMLAMLQRAAKGDVRAAEYIRDTIGQKPGMDMFADDFESDGFIEALKEGAKSWQE